MTSKEEITEAIKVHFAHVKERGRVLVQALKVRADIAAIHRRQRIAMADLGEVVYTRLKAGQKGSWIGDAELADYQMRIDGVRAELRQREQALQEIMEGRQETAAEQEEKPAEGAKGKKAGADAAGDAGKKQSTTEA